MNVNGKGKRTSREECGRRRWLLKQPRLETYPSMRLERAKQSCRNGLLKCLAAGSRRQIQGFFLSSPVRGVVHASSKLTIILKHLVLLYLRPWNHESAGRLDWFFLTTDSLLSVKAIPQPFSYCSQRFPSHRLILVLHQFHHPCLDT